jgi:hypothetical protein
MKITNKVKMSGAITIIDGVLVEESDVIRKNELDS